jgi:transcriptional regulator with XRE-family HTH domain
MSGDWSVASFASRLLAKHVRFRLRRCSTVVNHLRFWYLIDDGGWRSCWNAVDELSGDMRRGVDKAAWKAFGEWVEDLRVRTGLQVGEVAERAGVSRVWLQEIRNGGRGVPGGWRLPNPKNEALVRLARVLNVTPETMLARAGRGTAPSTTEAAAQVDDASAAERIRELEKRVAQQERELAELRQLLQRQARREDVS